MMPFDGVFAHVLAYGATDQATFRDLVGSFDGILVPGTIAAWQRQGTGGFVLSLSATEAAPPYVIDPRFPLFQQKLVNAKQSHIALAELLGDGTLIRTAEPSPFDFPDQRLREIAQAWVDFNLDYGATSNESFDKYAERLGEAAPELGNARHPEAILAPYFVASSPEDPWWALSARLFEHASDIAAGRVPCRRVVASTSGTTLLGLLRAVPNEENVAVWASGLDEHNAPVEELAAYRAALEAARDRGQRTFALYGGCFSVLLGASGLRGSAHGVGFSEHRNWRELPESGAPPPRYYVRRWHRYLPPALAQLLYERDPTLVRCDCEECRGDPPATVAADYHRLMKHSVRCRTEEIALFGTRSADTSARLLRDEYAAIIAQLVALNLLPTVHARATSFAAHLPRWADALY